MEVHYSYIRLQGLDVCMERLQYHTHEISDHLCLPPVFHDHFFVSM